MKNRTAFIFFLIGFLLQSIMVQSFNIVGISPNFLLCLTVLFAFLYKGDQGVAFGTIFGLLQDVCFSILIGPSAMLYFLIALIMGELRHYLYRDSILNIFFASAIGTGLYYILHWLIMMVFRGNYGFVYTIKALPILLAMHFFVCIIFYLAVGKRTIRHPEDRYYKNRRIYNN